MQISPQKSTKGTNARSGLINNQSLFVLLRGERGWDGSHSRANSEG
jgi:hypothetical protein